MDYSKDVWTGVAAPHQFRCDFESSTADVRTITSLHGNKKIQGETTA